MKIWRVEYDCNGGEYRLTVLIKARVVGRAVGFPTAIVADGVEIVFEEDVLSIEIQDELVDA